MELTKELEEAIVAPGPQGFHPPSAAELGVLTPEQGYGLKFGHVVAEELAMEAMARTMLTRKNATIFPGPMVLWNWNDHAADKARAVLELAAQLPDVLVIPMPDYRPKYPKVEPEEVINPNHPNLTIWGNKIEACIFIGVHCHYANLTLKMIRAGTNCWTSAICAEQGHEDAMFTVRDSDAAKIRRVAAVFKRVREEMGIKLPESGNNVRFTGLQSKVHGGKTHTNPLDFNIESPVDGDAAAFGHKAEHMQREA
ncbi:carbon monoxide dehydrogenase beta subunit family protein [Candidatus Nitrospira allomarina]|uniref:Carbon monoxide dehydrogenase beta subunit family protein n=1 Tax=Candidatus Nitrospira allomarina TaxID=3020900 RepID=A0AA96JZI7_9BACT|nr:carbon monoxide dehydrogenase beta subunit family protein [Candidatus Nitrospira allomarina]WNM58679.1 carbon monoxide dehydrogenase beta subunit family protein [Candidatus Nitrospira allomarina]